MKHCCHRDELNGDCTAPASRWFLHRNPLIVDSEYEDPLGYCERHALDLEFPSLRSHFAKEITQEEALVWRIQEQ